MLKKNDLAKQFELVVKQEIINFQKDHNSILQALRDQKAEIDKNKSEWLGGYAELHTLNKNLTILLQKSDFNKNQFTDIHKEIFDKIDELNQKIEKNKALRESNEKLFSQSIEDIWAHVTFQKNKINDLTDAFIELNNKINCRLELLSRSISKEMLAVKDQILSTPSPVESLYKQIYEKISENKIDVDGVLKEIRVNRSDLAIMQKQIEQIYMKLDRMNKAGGQK